MAFVVSLVFLLVFGFIEFARMVMVKQALTDAARHGCRTAALITTLDSADAEAAALSQLQSTVASFLDDTTCRVTVSPTSLSGMPAGTEITTRIDIDYSDISWISLGFLGNVTLQGESTMTRE
jgi:Flp pilus assembly protein TadG